MALVDRIAPRPLLAAAPPPLPFLVRQLGLLLLAVGAYFGVRHLTEGDAVVAGEHANTLIRMERSLGLFVERELQQWALSFDGVREVANAIYIWGHWPVIATVLCWLAWRRREAFFVHRNALLISGVVGMIIVATYPVAPPRLMDLGFVDTVTLHTESYRVLQPPSLTNQYAAMPSFHVGWDLLVGIALVREATWAWARAVGYVLPGLMFAAVVVTGNHYFVDGVVGDVIVLAALAIATALAATTVSRRQARIGEQSGAGEVASATAGRLEGRRPGFEAPSPATECASPEPRRVPMPRSRVM